MEREKPCLSIGSTSFINPPKSDSTLILSPSHENNSGLDPPIDPRVHIELDRLNEATVRINQLEKNLTETRDAFRHLLRESTERIEEMRCKLGACVDKSRPYYEARFHANESLRQSQLAAMRYERANSSHSAAREMVYLAEQGLDGRTLDPAWQEMLNHATQRVNDAEKERIISEAEHKFAYIKHETTNAKVKQLQKELKRAITKSSLSIRRSFLEMSSVVYRHELILLPYYEMKANFNHMLELQRNKVTTLEQQVQMTKVSYSDALRHLEQISDEIHHNRKFQNSLKNNSLRQISRDNISSCIDNFSEEFQTVSSKLNPLLKDSALDSKNIHHLGCYKSNANEKIDDVSCKLKFSSRSSSNEWTEINLDIISPEREYNHIGDITPVKHGVGPQQRLIRQNTMPNPKIENEYSLINRKAKLEHNISNWISRSAIVKEDLELNASGNSTRRSSLDNILGSTNEKMKEIFSQGMMMLNINPSSDRRTNGKSNSVSENNDKSLNNVPNLLEKSLTYLNTEDDISDSESCASADMLNEDQISSLMLDKDLSIACEQVLGTPIEEVTMMPKN